MRQLLPFPCDPVDPAVPYDDLPSARTRPAVRLNMIASIDGATAVSGVSGGLGGPADQALFAVLRSQADVVLVAAGTVRAERYGPWPCPWRSISGSWFTGPSRRGVHQESLAEQRLGHLVRGGPRPQPASIAAWVQATGWTSQFLSFV